MSKPNRSIHMQAEEIQHIKQQFDIIGNAPALNRAVEVAVQVAPTAMTVLITGESGSGKESFSKIIHRLTSTTSSSLSTVGLFQREPSTQSYLVIKKALLQVLLRNVRATLKRPMKALFFWTKLENFP